MRSYIGVWPVPSHQRHPTPYYPYVGRFYRAYNRLMYFAVTVIAFTMVLDLFRPETLRSVRLLADDLTMSTGVSMLWFKMFWYYRHNARLVRLFRNFQQRYRQSAALLQSSARIRAARCRFFLQDSAIAAAWTVCICFLYVAFTVQPWLHDDRNLMYRAVFPWPVSTSVGYRCTIWIQQLATLPCLYGILLLEVCGVLVVNQVHIIPRINELMKEFNELQCTHCR